jgi:hypothetical protein
MRRIIGRTGLAAAVASCLVAGCHRQAVQPCPQDPLISSKKYIVGQVDQPSPVCVVESEPEAPIVPQTALASAPADLDTTAHARLRRDPQAPRVVTQATPPPPVATHTVPIMSHSPVPASPAVRTREAGAPPAVSAAPASRINPAAEPPVAVRRQVSGTYGHSPDYAWLQGVLDRHFHGHFDLRYCDPTQEDAWGGKVCLDDDPRLAGLKDGDVVLVEGEIVRSGGKPVRGAWNHYPRYRIRNLTVIQSKP